MGASVPQRQAKEGETTGKEGKKSDAAHFIASVEREMYRNQIFAAWAQSHTDVFGR